MVAGESQPVLVELTAPKRIVERGLVDGLVVPTGTFVGRPVVDATLPDELVADLLAGAAHSPDGIAARAADGARALAIVAATAAALCGDDIREALRSPDTGFLTGLSGAAIEAVREVLLGIETDAPAELERFLRSALSG
ncbi:hypothetical protein [Nocardia sp. NBC_00416]|uniref:hypothetical protein n=1 Tax=Nocardia sp. NBC_00416 TaxID=2975991 RepID=UPI002E1BBCFF